MKQNDDIRSLYEQHRDRMLSLARFLLGDGEESRDVVSDVFASLLERPSADVSHPASFLLITVRNRCLNLLSRKQMKERVHKLLPIDEPTDDELPQDDQLEAMLRFIDTELTPKTRKVVHLRFEEHMTYRDIASHLGISEAAVYKHLAQAIRKLKQRFNP
jgi:RNA polymerase sigma-70 factor (ECF subfamily)